MAKAITLASLASLEGIRFDIHDASTEPKELIRWIRLLTGRHLSISVFFCLFFFFFFLPFPFYPFPSWKQLNSMERESFLFFFFFRHDVLAHVFIYTYSKISLYISFIEAGAACWSLCVFVCTEELSTRRNLLIQWVNRKGMILNDGVLRASPIFCPPASFFFTHNLLPYLDTNKKICLYIQYIFFLLVLS